MTMARLTQDRRRGMTPPPTYTPGTGAPVYMQPHGRGARPQQHPKCRAEEPSARRGGKQSKGGKLGHILQGKQGRAPMLLRQMFQTGSDRKPFHTAHHSTRWTLIICTSNAGSIHTSQTGKNPGHCGETLGRAYANHQDVGAPCPIRDDS